VNEKEASHILLAHSLVFWLTTIIAAKLLNETSLPGVIEARALPLLFRDKILNSPAFAAQEWSAMLLLGVAMLSATIVSGVLLMHLEYTLKKTGESILNTRGDGQ